MLGSEIVTTKKPSPRDLLESLRRLNPDATAADIKDPMLDLAKKFPDDFAKQMFDELFDQFIKETNFRGQPQNAHKKFEAWLKKPKN
jgi:hypothetical protein